MADIIQTQGPQGPQGPPGPSGGGGGSAAGWAVAVVILLAAIAWFVFGGGLHRQTTYRADVKITPPTTQSPPSGGSASGSVAVPPRP